MSVLPTPASTPPSPPVPATETALAPAPATPVAAASAVACTRCGRPFIAPTDQPAAVIECPWCGSQARRDSLQASAPKRQSRLLRAVWWGVVAGLLTLGVLGAVAFGLQWFHPSSGRSVPRASAQPHAASATQRLNESIMQEARAAAERALACPDWTSARPLLLDAERLAPLMERYHARHPWTPVALVGAHQGTVSSTGGVHRVDLSVRSDRGFQLALHLERTPEGWKMDWERLVNARHFAWQMFHEDRPTTPTPLQVLALRGSATDAYFADAGFTQETALAVRLDGPRSGLPALAIVPKASDLGRLFHRDLTWQQPRPYRCLLRMANPTLVPPRVEITEFEGEGWEEGAVTSDQ